MKNELYTPDQLVLLMHKLSTNGIRFSKIPAGIYTTKGISGKAVVEWIKSEMELYENDRMEEVRNKALDLQMCIRDRIKIHPGLQSLYSPIVQTGLPVTHIGIFNLHRRRCIQFFKSISENRIIVFEQLFSFIKVGDQFFAISGEIIAGSSLVEGRHFGIRQAYFCSLSPGDFTEQT